MNDARQSNDDDGNEAAARPSHRLERRLRASLPALCDVIWPHLPLFGGLHPPYDATRPRKGHARRQGSHPRPLNTGVGTGPPGRTALPGKKNTHALTVE